MQLAEAVATFRRLGQAAAASSSSHPLLSHMIHNKPHPLGPIYSAPISKLTPIRLSNLQPGTPALGQLLHGTLATEALIKLHLQVPLVLTVLLPDHDHPTQGEPQAVLLAIKHAIGSQASPQQVRAAFPRGARVAIKEPILMKPEPDKSLAFIPLDNPANLEVISYDQELELLRGKSPAEIRARGNALFGEGCFQSAAQAYRLCSDRAKNVDPGEQLLALSNQAQCLLQLGRFEECIDVADEALSLDPTHAKTIHRKAAALIKLHLYDWATTFLEGFTGINSPAAINELHSRARKLAEQSRSGTSFLEVLTWLTRTTVAPGVEFPELAEYVGPVEVRMCSDQSFDRGRGLFATRRIAKGEVVLFTHGWTTFQQRDAAATFLDLVMKSHRDFDRVRSLVKGETRLLSELEVPGMDLFRPNWITADEWGSYREKRKSPESRELLEGISMKLIFQFVNLARNGDEEEDLDARTSTIEQRSYLLLAFINHACVPNACHTRFKGTIMLLATREIEEGDEIVCSYFNAGSPLRNRRLEEWGMRCECLKCEVEKKLGPELEELVKWYDEYSTGGDASNAPAMVVKLESVLRSRLESEDERQCVRAVFWILYMVYYEQVRVGKAWELGGVPGVEVIMAATLKFSAGTMTSVELDGLRMYARDKHLAEKIIREEWECRFGKMDDGLYQLARRSLEF